MSRTPLWTKQFVMIVIANGLLFSSFHALLPTLPMYVASLGASGSAVGIITGIFGISAIFIRLFTDDVVRKFGKKKCLYAGILLTILATFSFTIFTSLQMLVAARIIQGFGFGLGTTFAAALAVDIIPASRRGEGVGYFGLGSTVAMGSAPALGVLLLTDFNANYLFTFSIAVAALSIVSAASSGTPAHTQPLHEKVHVFLLSRFFEKGTAFPAFFTMLFGFSYGGVNTFIVLMAQEAHIENAGLFFVVGTIFIFLTRTFGGRIYDTKGPFWILFPGILSYTMATFVITQATSFALLMVSAVLYGTGAGLIMPSLMTWLFNSVRPERRSNASATYYNTLDTGTSGGIMILGSVAGVVGYITMFYVIFAVMVLFLGAFLGQYFFHPVPVKKREIEES